MGGDIRMSLRPHTPSSHAQGHRHLYRRVPETAKRDYRLHVRPSVRTEHIGSHWTGFHEILHPSII